MAASFPERDAAGRVARLTDLLALTAVGLVAGFAVLTAFDGAFSLLGLGDFGQVNGWLSVVLPAWQFFEELRAVPRRVTAIPAAVIAAAVGLAVGLPVSGLAGAAPPLLAGAVGAAAFVPAYALVWFFGMRLLAPPDGRGS